MITLNQIKSKLVTFFKNHAQVNTVFYGDNYNFAAENAIVYPAANIEYLQSNLADRKIVHNYKVTICDLDNQNLNQYQDEIFSDCMQIADDFFSYLYTEYDFEFTKSTSIQNFVDNNRDRTAGLVFTVALAVIRPQNECVTPIK